MEQRPPHPVGRCFIPLTILLAPHRKRQGSLTETNASIVRRDFVIGYQFQTAPLALPGNEIHEEHVLHTRIFTIRMHSYELCRMLDTLACFRIC